jgi:hypothetical protein
MRAFRLRFTIRRAMALVAVTAALCAITLSYRRIVEELDSPVKAAGWSEAGLLLSDGRSVKLPGIELLPPISAALTEATCRGVELNRDGRVYGLVRVHHWCGNDPVREHVARVDLSYLVAFVGEGRTADVMPQELRLRMANGSGGRFGARGWELGEFYQFKNWCRIAEELRFTAAAAGTGPPSRKSRAESGNGGAPGR